MGVCWSIPSFDEPFGPRTLPAVRAPAQPNGQEANQCGKDSVSKPLCNICIRARANSAAQEGTTTNDMGGCACRVK